MLPKRRRPQLTVGLLGPCGKGIENGTLVAIFALVLPSLAITHVPWGASDTALAFLALFAFADQAPESVEADR